MFDKFFVDTSLLILSTAWICLHLEELLNVVLGLYEEATVEGLSEISSLQDSPVVVSVMTLKVPTKT
jgi:hypothetical protein